jgi:hypothetical protein
MQLPAHRVHQEDLRPLGEKGAADEAQRRGAGGDPRGGDPQDLGAGDLLAHQRARGAADIVHDADRAREQVGQLGQEQRRPQPVHQHAVQRGLVRPRREDLRVQRRVALAAARRHDEVHLGHAPAQPRIIDGEAGDVDAEPLPILHLPVFAARDALREGDRRQRMHRVRGEAGFVHHRRGAGQRARMHFPPDAERRGEREALDEDRARHNRPIAAARVRTAASSAGAGKGRVFSVSSASAARVAPSARPARSTA